MAAAAIHELTQISSRLHVHRHVLLCLHGSPDNITNSMAVEITASSYMNDHLPSAGLQVIQLHRTPDKPLRFLGHNGPPQTGTWSTTNTRHQNCSLHLTPESPTPPPHLPPGAHVSFATAFTIQCWFQRTSADMPYNRVVYCIGVYETLPHRAIVLRTDLAMIGSHLVAFGDLPPKRMPHGMSHA